MKSKSKRLIKLYTIVGEYQLCQPYKTYEVASIKEWFKKNQMQRERILQLKADDQAEQDDVSLEVLSDVIDQGGP